MIVREITDVDPSLVEQIVALEQDAFGIGGMNHWFLVPFIRHGRVFIVCRGDEVVGVCEYMLDFRCPDQAYLFGFTVKSCWRRRGVGERLLRESCSILKQEGIKLIALTVHPENTGARRLYEKLGFVQTGFHKDEYGPGEDRLEYVLELENPKEKML
ncbi:MAG: GNAT family N-acetyltransferase [Firmicutes bacterium]|jgi:ribosomal-protein-alanine N-acetyltransferase|nr:GNAT family N-acetyltransferase [Bacillota bacterium]